MMVVTINIILSLKETIRMQVRVSYKAGSNDISETLSIDGLPVT